MSEFTYPLPPALNGDRLEEELAAAGLVAQAVVVAGQLVVRMVPDPEEPEAVEPQVAALVAAHTGEPTAAHAAELALRDDGRAAMQELRALRQLGRNAFMAETAAERDRRIYDALVAVTRVLIETRRDL